MAIAQHLGYDDLPALMTRLTGDEKHDWSSLSTLDVLWVLYDRVLTAGDRFLLSKGHGPAAYYAVLAAKGFIPVGSLAGFGSFDSPLGFRHGPKTIVTGDTLVFVFMSNDPYTRGYDLDLLRELRSDALAGRVIAVAAQVHDAVTQGEHLHVPHLADATDGDVYFPYIVCGQLYAFHRSLSVGNTPDQPSNSGTVSRVVSGVTIHTL